MTLRIEQDNRLRRITLAGVEQRNLIDAVSAARLVEELRDAVAHEGTGAILIDADGPVFCSGIEGDAAELFSFSRRMSKPLVVAAQGVVISGGVALLASAHVVVAAQGTSFGLIDIREGKWREEIYHAVAGAIGERRATELSLTGRIFTTPDAVAWGLVHMSAPAFEIADRATDVATALANANADAVRAALRR